jgi:hypothetical protein
LLRVCAAGLIDTAKIEVQIRAVSTEGAIFVLLPNGRAVPTTGMDFHSLVVPAGLFRLWISAEVYPALDAGRE